MGAPSSQPGEAHGGHPAEAYAVKRGLGRAWGFGALSLGVWTFYWFYSNRKLLDRELAHGRDDALLHTLGLLVPVLNYFVIYWLWRDVDRLRRWIGMPPFQVVGYVIGAIFVAPLFYSLALLRLNEYWDARTGGLATEAPVTTAEKGFIAAGAALLGFWLLVVVIVVIVAIAVSAAG